MKMKINYVNYKFTNALDERVLMAIQVDEKNISWKQFYFYPFLK